MDRFISPEATLQRRQEEKDQKLFQPIELQSEEEIIQFWLTYWRNNGISIKGTKQEIAAARSQAKQTLRDSEANQENPVHLYGIIDNNQMVAVGKLTIFEHQTQGKTAYLSSLAVDPEYRGKSIAKRLTDVRIEKGKQEGCEYVDTEVFATNARALVTKLNDDFLIKSPILNEGVLMGFLLSKRIRDDRDSSQRKRTLGLLQEVNLNDQLTLVQMLESGWVGIDMKNLGDPDDNDPAKWVVILEKSAGLDVKNN